MAVFCEHTQTGVIFRLRETPISCAVFHGPGSEFVEGLVNGTRLGIHDAIVSRLENPN
jgi:hypothetical protein